MKPRRDLISFGFRKMWGAVWGVRGAVVLRGMD